MRIGFDGKRATQNFTGLGNYSRFVLELLAKWHPENEYQVFAIKSPDKSRQLEFSEKLIFRFPSSALLKKFWRTYGIVKDLKRGNVDLYHGLSGELPFGLKKAGILSVVTVHDLIFMRYPGYFPYIDRQIYRWKTRYATLNADRVIAISEQTKTDLVTLMNVPEEKIDVVYQNCDAAFKLPVPENFKKVIKAKYQLPDQFLLSVGTIETRKNLMLTVKALKHLDRSIKLVVIGKKTPYTEIVGGYIRAEQLSDQVVFINNVPFSDLPAIYQMAQVFVYPSEFEGFGIPILEAISSGVPVVAARGSSLEEAGGNSSIYIDPKDHVALAHQLNLILADKTLRNQIIEAGYKHLERFSEKVIADQINSIYLNIFSNAARRSQ